MVSWLVLCGCRHLDSDVMSERPNSFSEDLAFLQKHTQSFVLSSGDAKIAVTPEYQGRVMTSTTGGADDLSFGWLNYDLIRRGPQSSEAAKGQLEEHIHVFGGEERFWMGPEGGQFAIFFKAGSKFEFEDWFTPAVIDTEPFVLKNRSESEAVFTRRFELQNYSGATFQGNIRRRIRVLNKTQTGENLGIDLPESLECVGYETENQLKNIGENPWTRDTGALSIWILGMYKPSPRTTVVIPFKTGAESDRGPIVNDAYFGKVPGEKLVIGDGVLFFSGDGTYRSKIGINPKRSRSLVGSYDAPHRTLTLVTYDQPARDLPYVNSMWEHQDDPFAGDALNAYNDGPPEPGAAPLGPFYELETSSPAALLAPNESLTHVQRTFHLKGDEETLNVIATGLLGVDLEQIQTALEPPRIE